MPRDLDRLAIDELLSEFSDDQLPALLLAVAARLMRNGNGTHSATSEGSSDRLLTAREAAAKCGFSTHWIYQHADTLPFVVRKGRSLRFSEVGIEKFIRLRSGR